MSLAHCKFFADSYTLLLFDHIYISYTFVYKANIANNISKFGMLYAQSLPIVTVKATVMFQHAL